MIYKSAPLTFIYKYLLPIVVLLGGIIMFITLKNNGDESTSNIVYAFGIIFFWNALFLIQLPFRLKKITIDKDGVSIKSGNGAKIIPFKDIKAVSKYDLFSPWMMTIKYVDSKKQEERKISYKPHSKYERFLKADDMTAYLREQAKINNSHFEESNTIKNYLILALAELPCFIGMCYFIYL